MLVLYATDVAGGGVGAAAAPAHTCVGKRRKGRADMPLVRHDLTMDDVVFMTSS
jgi:hypothetical protein